MSVKVSSWVWHGEETADLSGNEMILLLALADVAADDGRCRYMAEDDDLSYDGLATKVRVDRRTIERLIPKLRDRGLLEQVKGTKTRPNEFRVLVPWASASADKVSGNDSDIPRQRRHIPRQREQDSPTNDASAPLYIRTDVRDVVNAHPTFDDFWAIWPRKDAKKTASSAWDRAVKRADPQLIVDAARAYVSSPHRPEKKFVPYGATWLNGERWTDPLPEAAPAPQTFARQRQDNSLAIFEHYKNQEESHAEVRDSEAADVQALDRGR